MHLETKRGEPDAANFTRGIRARAWLIAVLALLVAMGGRSLLSPWLGDALPFVFAFPAVALVSIFVGSRVGIAVALGAVLWVAIPGLPPKFSVEESGLQTLLFLPSAMVIAFVCGRATGRNPSLISTKLPIQVFEIATLQWLRFVIAVSMVLPGLIFILVGLYTYQSAMNAAADRMDRVGRIVAEHALKVFETNESLLGRVLDLAGVDDDTLLRNREKALHDRMKRFTEKLPQVQSAWLHSATGQALASDRFYPVPRDISFADRDYFLWHRDDRGGVFFTDLLLGRVSGSLFFDLSRRRSQIDGSFAGVASVSLRPDYFHEFYASLAATEPGLRVLLMRSDGAILASYPQSPVENGRTPEHGPLSRALSAGQSIVATDVLNSRDGTELIANLLRLDPYPVYVTAGVARDAVIGVWLRDMAVLAAFTFPIALMLCFMTYVALVRTRTALDSGRTLREEAEERLRLEESLRQSQKMEAMGRLTGSVAHDFNNLLMIVSNNVYLLKRLLPHRADGSPLAAIERAVATGTQLTRQLLAFTRLQALKPEVIRLQEKLPELATLLGSLVGKRFDIEVNVDPNTAPIEVDVAELELAMINLAANARDAMPAGGRLSITALNAMPDKLDMPNAAAPISGPAVVIQFADAGCGIAPEQLEQVFEPFFTTKPLGKGTGLGLSQVQGFCSRSNGFVAVESTVGVGTLFKLWFPAASETASMAPNPAGSAGVPTLNCRILLVEDNDELAAGVEQLLLSLGCTVKRAASADAGAALLEHGSNQFDLVLSDVATPGMLDGIALAELVRSRFPRIEVMLMSGYAERLETAVGQGFTVLTKPSSPHTIAVAIAAKLNKRAAA